MYRLVVDITSAHKDELEPLLELLHELKIKRYSRTGEFLNYWNEGLPSDKRKYRVDLRKDRDLSDFPFGDFDRHITMLIGRKVQLGHWDGPVEATILAVSCNFDFMLEVDGKLLFVPLGGLGFVQSHDSLVDLEKKLDDRIREKLEKVVGDDNGEKSDSV